MPDTAQSRSDIEAALYSYLSTRFPLPVAYDRSTPLLDGGAVDSLGVLELMSFLTERFGIAIDDSDFDPENLETPDRLVQFIERKRS